jgi:signal transduction histidine kinase
LSVAEGLDSRRGSGNGQPVASKSSDGRLWFPDWHALAVFDPAQAPQDSRPHLALIEEALADGERVIPAAAGAVRISSAVRRLEIHFTLPNLRVPERLRFRCQLIGFDPDWLETGPRRVAYYTHLPPGGYEFDVQAGSPAGQWQGSARRLRLEVVPQLWERLSAQTVGGLLLIGAVAGTVWAVSRARFRRRVERLEAQQALERERRRIAQDLHDDLGGDLTKLMLLGDRMEQEVQTVEQFKAQSSEMSSNLRQLVRDMDQVVWTVNPENDFVADFAGYLSSFAPDFLGQTGIRCRLDVMSGFPDAALPAQKRHSLFLAAKEALHNVLKHSGASEVWVRIHCTDGELVVVIEDNGRGFDPLTTPPSTADGLGNMRERLKALGGTCEVSSAVGKGTTISLRMPVRTF